MYFNLFDSHSIGSSHSKYNSKSFYKMVERKKYSKRKTNFFLRWTWLGNGVWFSKTSTFPDNLYPNNFYDNFYETPSSFYGKDGVNGSYQSRNSSVWYKPPFSNSNLKKSLYDFLEQFFMVSACSVSENQTKANKVITRRLKNPLRFTLLVDNINFVEPPQKENLQVIIFFLIFRDEKNTIFF